MRKYSSRDTYVRDVRFDWTGGGGRGRCLVVRVTI